MTIKKLLTKHYEGLSTDTKPTGVLPGTTFREIDTNAMYISNDGSNWIIANKAFSTGQATGETTNDYVSALDWDTRFLRDKSLLLKNTDDANGLKYKLITQYFYGGQDYEEVSERILALGTTVTFQYTKPYACMKLQVKAEVADSQADYLVEYIGYGV